ncbi:MAG: hypothetical protein JJE30_11300 [Desulfuromonadales bacterium]|nr:hypothetical protein [Desulfuromonadales bacterium]
MFSLLGDQNKSMLLQGFEVTSVNNVTTVSSAKCGITIDIDNSTHPPFICSTTMTKDCGDGSNCFDHLAAAPSECPSCQFATDCPGARFLPYMPEIYIASTYKPYVRKMNVELKEAVHSVGLMPMLPQHLSVGNPNRNVIGGLLAENPETRGGELATLGGRWCEAVMRRCDGGIVVLNRMGQDSSWETGFMHALRVPLLAVYYSDEETDPLKDFAMNWMVRLAKFDAIVPYPSKEADQALKDFRRKLHLNKQATI